MVVLAETLERELHGGLLARVQPRGRYPLEERSVSLGQQTHQLSPLFTVLATQNPIEYEGTYPLPEAQLDRFMTKLLVRYPSLERLRL